MKEDLNYAAAPAVDVFNAFLKTIDVDDEKMKSTPKKKFRELPKGKMIGDDVKSSSNEPVDEELREKLKDTDGEEMKEAQDVYAGPTGNVQSEYPREVARGDGQLNAGSTPYNINIKPLAYGYEVSVGCQTFAVEKPSTLGNFITEYLTNPKKTTNHWYANEGKDRLAAYRD